jgi:hypothetical protein
LTKGEEGETTSPESSRELARECPINRGRRNVDVAGMETFIVSKCVSIKSKSDPTFGTYPTTNERKYQLSSGPYETEIEW